MSLHVYASSDLVPQPSDTVGSEASPVKLWPEALEHLDLVIGEFRDMKMQPSLERALRFRGVLKAWPSEAKLGVKV